MSREITPASARASAAAAPMTTLRPAAEPRLAVVVQLAAAYRAQRMAAARKAQGIAATGELLRPAGADMTASACAAARRPAAAEALMPLISWASGSARKLWQFRGTFVAGRP